MSDRSYAEIACQQVLTADGSVFSIQWTILPPEMAARLSPERLQARYLDYIRRCTLSLIRPQSSPEGVSFRLAGTRVSLIAFLPPEQDAGTLRLRICGGVLVQPQECRSGEISFAAVPTPEGCRASVMLSDFCPLLLGSRKPSLIRKWLYRCTQAYIHRMVTVGFLAGLVRELYGPGVCVRTVAVSVRDGEKV